MSIILGALSGAGEQVVDMAKAQQKKWDVMEEAKASADLAEQKAISLERFKNALAVSTADQQRTGQVSRINEAAAPLILQAQMDKLNRGYGNAPGTLTKDDVLPEELDANKLTPEELLNVKIQAGAGTGDVDLLKAKEAGRKDDALLYKALFEQQKEEGRNNRADDRLAESARQSDNRMALLMARVTAAGAKDPKDRAMEVVDSRRKDLAAELASIRQVYQAEIKDMGPDEKAARAIEYKAAVAEIEERRKPIEQDYQTLRVKYGMAKEGEVPVAPKATPAPAPLTALPAGAKQIGTSNGKAVYQLPNGQRVLEQ